MNDVSQHFLFVEKENQSYLPWLFPQFYQLLILE